jgi:hypothetical protein
LLKLFKNRGPESYIFLLFYSFILNGVLYFKALENFEFSNSFLFAYFELDLSVLPKTLLVSISILTLYVQALFINNIVSKFRLSHEPSMLPGFMFVTIVSIFSEVILLNPSFLAMFLLLLVIQNLLPTFDLENVIQRMFYISFYIGIGSLVYSPLVFFIFMVLISFPILKSPKASEYFIIPIGFITPFYLVGLAFYMYDSLPIYFDFLKDSLPAIGYQGETISLKYIIPLSYVLLLVITGFVQNVFFMPNKTVRQVRYQRVFIILFTITFLLIFLTSLNKMHVGYYFSIPVGVLLSILFSESNRKLYDAMFIGLLVIVGVSQYLNF